MHDYYCKCKNIVGKWNDKYKDYDIVSYCNLTKIKNINSMYFLDCNKCNKYVGTLCYNVCKNCFGKNEIFGEKKIFNWFQNYKKKISQNVKGKFICEFCDENNTRWQHWFPKELTFIKKKN